MALSKVQMTLIQYLKAFGIEEHPGVGIMLLLQGDEEAQQMIDWLKENVHPSLNQIWAKALELTKLESEE